MNQTSSEADGDVATTDTTRDETEDGCDDSGEAVLRLTRISRRRFLLVAGAAVAGLAAAIGLVRRTGSSNDDVNGGVAKSVQNLVSRFPINSVEETPGKTWSDWNVRVNGLVEKPLTLDAAAWAALPRYEETADFHCVEGWSVNDVHWGGVAPAAILERAKVRPGGRFLVFHAYTGEYVDSLPIALALDPQTILADTMDDAPLPEEHGGPLRLVVPAQYGYKSVKWVTRIEVTEKPARGYWEQRGYPSDADLGAPTERWGPAPIDDSAQP